MLMRLQVRGTALPPARDPYPPGKTWAPRSSTRPDAIAAMGLFTRRRIESRTTGVHVSSRSRWRLRLAGSTLSSPRPVRLGPAQQNSAPLAQSAERLHGKNPARNGVLTCINADETRALCTELDALNPSLNDLVGGASHIGWLSCFLRPSPLALLPDACPPGDAATSSREALTVRRRVRWL